jgi:hypothetical protein
MLPMGAPTHSVCPTDSGTLRGLTKQQVTAKLQKADFIDRRDASWTYFFTSPVPSGQFGGGFPELTFHFDTKGTVASVSCYYSR